MKEKRLVSTGSGLLIASVIGIAVFGTAGGFDISIPYPGPNSYNVPQDPRARASKVHKEDPFTEVEKDKRSVASNSIRVDDYHLTVSCRIGYTFECQHQVSNYLDSNEFIMVRQSEWSVLVETSRPLPTRERKP
ncbi:hypothetical protein A3D66_02995 [Candidatus Kaiserbacteria bacterium RIFCSPHIGHO2_02_FULL_50_9]|uniref:Uncharacterized protein n=1 Tax=Candidatus Kaiserbacteria bacterium RIFCSPLOWO2_01_FULL_51_21 TaxID=1798508 RepID=A0A1F6ECK9_9BACT|nr:MAG: hypothetical protein A2761_01390 [Candidatus Kaiserbacteria bacterium RIFCSPHIGHO2_01_FULL_51_33]OGG63647.1 MAG: hypothetical protein A3D66_02995 [Candidatus Kaiserbacteria bacterium RIFCSPHIGHO2_02_FULL_50_9]OGG71408.1 MAG: hypothetical protein A3A35_01540 [Candidatus Kaiserbacteria bacterium RIFCSPLOWO2_01_FULL_51_21]